MIRIILEMKVKKVVKKKRKKIKKEKIQIHQMKKN